MSEWYDNQSAEVVLRQPRKLNATHCLPKCLKLFTQREISWLLVVEGDKRDGDARALALGISIAESKKLKARMTKCLKKCVRAAEEKAWNEDQRLPQNNRVTVMKNKEGETANSGSLILIVDDAAETRLIRREILEREGYRVIEAEDGKQGVEAAIRERPGLILMNYLMPVMNGLEATRQIRQQPGLKSVPIFMNSACSSERTRELALLAGCDDYLEEPCFFDELLEKIAQFANSADNSNE